MQRNGQLPKWLYEVLPYIYLLGSFATAAMIRSVLGMISAMLLLSAAALVLMMRHNYRSASQPAAPVPELEAGQRNGAQGAELLQVAWRPSFEIGLRAIDRQHQRLTSLGNELITALIQHKPREDVEVMLDVLVAELGIHLKQEQEITAGQDTPAARRAREAHRALLARATELRDRFLVGELPVGDLVGFVAYDLIVMHVVREDLRSVPREPAAPAVRARSLPKRNAAVRVGSPG